MSSKTWKNSADDYGRIAIVLHWLMALVISALWLGGQYMQGLSWRHPDKASLYYGHKVTGLVVLLLAVVRLWNRWRRVPRHLPMARWEQLLAHAGHHTLYLLMFLMPLSGWIMSSVIAKAPTIYGISTNLPIPKTVFGWSIGQISHSTHWYASRALALVVLAHILGAFKHAWWDRQAIFYRMGLARNPALPPS